MMKYIWKGYKKIGKPHTVHTRDYIFGQPRSRDNNCVPGPHEVKNYNTCIAIYIHVEDISKDANNYNSMYSLHQLDPLYIHSVFIN